MPPTPWSPMPRMPSESVTMRMSISSGSTRVARSDCSMASGSSIDRKTPFIRWYQKLNAWIASPMVGV